MKQLSIICAIYLMPVLIYAYKPQAPQNVLLNENEIMKVSLNRKLETLLLFPHQIEHLSGSGLVNQGKGQVQYQVGATRKTLTLKPLVGDFRILIHVMVAGKVYAIQLKDSSDPATVVRFKDNDTVGLEVTSKIDLVEVEERVRLPSEQRVKELVRLAKEEAFLKKQLPHLYTGSDSRLLDVTVEAVPYWYVMDRVIKFQREDTLVFTGRVHYRAGAGETQAPGKLNIQLNISERANYSFTYLDVYRDTKNPKKPLRFVGVLVGDGQGKPGHINLYNDFGLEITQGAVSQRRLDWWWGGRDA